MDRLVEVKYVEVEDIGKRRTYKLTPQGYVLFRTLEETALALSPMLDTDIQFDTPRPLYVTG